MRKHFLFATALVILLCLTITAHATPVPNGTLLTIAPGAVTSGGEDGLASGSGFALGDGIGVGDIDGWFALLPGTDGGIKIGSSQPKKAIVSVSTYSGSPIYHYTSSPTYADPETHYLDFSGWNMFWGGGTIPRGSTSDYTFTAISSSTYRIDGFNVCSHPTDANFIFNGTGYTLHLEGNIIPALVPEPASLLLLGSGLAGLAGAVWRRRKQ